MKYEDGIYEEEYTTRFAQTLHGEVSNKNLLSYLEDTGGAHSAHCKFSITDIEKDNLTWFILAWKMKVIKRPKASEKIKIQTWGRPIKKLFMLRDFKIFNKTGEIIAIATSKWCLIDTRTGKIAKVPDNIEEIYHKFREESVFEMDDIKKLTVPSGEIIKNEEYKIRRFDLDGNKHVHNLNYVNFAYEILPEEIYDGKELNNIEIMYKKEIKYGEKIKSLLYVENGVYTIVIKDETEEIIHAIVKLYNS